MIFNAFYPGMIFRKLEGAVKQVNSLRVFNSIFKSMEKRFKNTQPVDTFYHDSRQLMHIISYT